MLRTILNLKGARKLSKKEQQTIKGSEFLCKSNGMCAQYGNQCEELACKEVPHFDINLV